MCAHYVVACSAEVLFSSRVAKSVTLYTPRIGITVGWCPQQFPNSAYSIA